MMKRMIALMLAVMLVLCGCQKAEKASDAVTEIKFTDAVNFDSIQKLEGQTVSIVGYMATLSPVNGEYMYLMNMPYQSCPFCVPNTSQLSNTMAVYARSGKTFDYTDQAIRVTGTMTVQDYTDDFGYEYNYCITDAVYEVVDLSTVSEEYALWQTIAADGVVADINAMFDYLHFVCQWTEYQSGYTDENGNEVTYRLYPGDAIMILEDDGPYGYADEYSQDYFPGLIQRLRAISTTELEDLVAIVQRAQALEIEAIDDLNQEKYSYDEINDVYVLDRSETLYNRWYEVYAEFSNWLAKWEI